MAEANGKQTRKRAPVDDAMEAIIDGPKAVEIAEQILNTVDPPSKPKPQQSKAAEARYAGERATETELRAHFQSVELPQAFALYERMRKNLEIAGRILNDRANVPEVQSCKTCGLSLEDYKKKTRKNDWFLNRHYHHRGDHNIILTDHFCSVACVSYENNKTQGVYGMSDQGMLPAMNPKNHPHTRGG